MIRKLQHYISHDAHPIVQFIKYGVSGGIATGTNLIILYILAAWVWPCLTEDDMVRSLLNLPIAENLNEQLRATRAFCCNIPAFILSNGVAYLLNILFVFRGGRHHWFIEVALFYLVSGISFAIGVSLQSLLISQLAISTSAAFGANILAALLINFAVRKFFIFKG